MIWKKNETHRERRGLEDDWDRLGEEGRGEAWKMTGIDLEKKVDDREARGLDDEGLVREVHLIYTYGEIWYVH